MKSIKNRCIQPPCLLAALALSFSAHAASVYTTVDFPGAASTSLWGITNQGTAVGNAFDASFNLIANFAYDIKKGTFTTIDPATLPAGATVIGINEPGDMVGGGGDPCTNSATGFVRSKQGAFVQVAHPGYGNTEFRGINNSGAIAGLAYTVDAGCNVVATTGFVYDSAHNTFTDFLPTPGPIISPIAQGIANNGDVVGSAILAAGVACTGCVAGRYGFLRKANGAVEFFRVNSADTAARGITDSGKVAGFNYGGSSFVVSLKGVPWEAITVAPADLIAVPGAISTTAEGISNPGTISGIFIDAGDIQHGFVVTSNGKK